MANLKGRAILTINDDPDMRHIYAGFATERLRTSYTVGGGAKAKPVGELTRPPVTAQTARAGSR